MTQDVKSKPVLDPNESWMIRPCDQYHEEYKECLRWKARLFQRFVHGEMKDCKIWKADRDNCLSWEVGKMESAAEAVIASEKKRRLERLYPHVQNKVWEKREKPPEDWNKPLPEFMERTKYSYITSQLKREKGESLPGFEELKPSCSIQ